MSPVVHFFISGEALGWGVTLSLLAVLLSLHPHRVTVRFAAALHMLGVLLFVLSSSWFGVTLHVMVIGLPALVLVIAWSIAARQSRVAEPRSQAACSPSGNYGYCRYALILIAASLLARELVRVRREAEMPSILVALATPLHVVGDSLSAASDDGTPVWSELFQKQSGIAVTNHARAGSTTLDALKQAEDLPPDSFVVIEIGGNDLLNGKSSEVFGEQLRDLLDRICRDGRKAVMFELPLPPFCNGFARQQRFITSEFNVPLIPRRVLADVLAPEENTVDGLHLTATGHRALSAILFHAWRAGTGM